jgi:hypothetical protein
MPGALPHYTKGPASYQVSAAVTGGQLVCKTTANSTTIIPNVTAGATNILGVAGNDAAPIVSQAGNTTAYGDPLLDISALGDYVAVYSGGGIDMHVVYEAACDFGDLLMAAATAGNVKKYVAGTADQIVGRCTQPGGVTAGATLARARIF